MSKHLDVDLERLHRSLLRMAGYVEDAVVTAATALRARNPEACARVVAGDADIDRLENEVQDECLKILALHQPVAVVLRRISAVLMITTDLERIGDLAVGIAERAAVVSRPPYVPIPEAIGEMLDLSEAERAALGSRARAHVIARHSPETERDAYAELYHRLLDPTLPHTCLERLR